MTLDKKRWLMIGLLILGVLTLVITESTLCTALGIGLVVAGIVVDFVWIRCPHCGTWLGANPGKLCKICGREIDYHAK